MEKLVARNAELEKDVKVAVEELSITKEASTRKTVCEHHTYPTIINCYVNASCTERIKCPHGKV